MVNQDWSSTVHARLFEAAREQRARGDAASEAASAERQVASDLEVAVAHERHGVATRRQVASTVSRLHTEELERRRTAEREREHERRRLEAERQGYSELTFAPRLGQRSLDLARKSDLSFEDRLHGDARRNRAVSDERERVTSAAIALQATPRITDKGAALHRDGEIGDRLHTEALERRKKRRLVMDVTPTEKEDAALPRRKTEALYEDAIRRRNDALRRDEAADAASLAMASEQYMAPGTVLIAAGLATTAHDRLLCVVNRAARNPEVQEALDDLALAAEAGCDLALAAEVKPASLRHEQLYADAALARERRRAEIISAAVDEVAQCTFAPQLTRTVRQKEPVEVRSEEWLQRRDDKLRWQQDAKADLETDGCTFAPRLNESAAASAALAAARREAEALAQRAASQRERRRSPPKTPRQLKNDRSPPKYKPTFETSKSSRANATYISTTTTTTTLSRGAPATTQQSFFEQHPQQTPKRRATPAKPRLVAIPSSKSQAENTPLPAAFQAALDEAYHYPQTRPPGRIPP